MASQKAPSGAERISTNTKGTAERTRESSVSKMGAMNAGTKQNRVKVTFNVTVPEDTADAKHPVYIAGNFHQVDSQVVDWDTQGIKMKRASNTLWTATVNVPENTVLEYKYCLGQWDNVERDPNCNDIANRRLEVWGNPTGLVEIDDTVHRWRNTAGCGA